MESDGRPVGTRNPDLYRVKGPLLCTSNNFKDVGSFLKACKYGEAETITGEITGEELLLTSRAMPRLTNWIIKVETRGLQQAISFPVR
jgi:hypothetical protein